MTRDDRLTATLRAVALAAGRAIMDVYRRSEFRVTEKADSSPVTEADLVADDLILAGLRDSYPDVPVVSEERLETHRRANEARHFLVDPLDGTREFVSRRGEFTVNIALIENGRPISGVVYAPALERLFMTTADGPVEEQGPFGPAPRASRRLATAPIDPAALRIVASKSHRDAATDAYIAGYPVGSIKSAGSSLKFCLLAAGEADLYPRLGPTMEWDTAAGHALLEAAGGAVARLDNGARLEYGKADRRNPPFAASAPGVAVRRWPRD